MFKKEILSTQGDACKPNGARKPSGAGALKYMWIVVPLDMKRGREVMA
jgi:hypothetical protein